MQENIILIGFMGTGKTAVGKRLASILNMDFYDTDQEIEKVTGMSINKLFQKHGEIRLKSEEALIVKKLRKLKNSIIATGGGMVLDRNNIETLKQTGTLICLTADPEVIYERVKRRNTRPLLRKGDDLHSNIINLMQEREEFYRSADKTIDTSNLDFDEIINEILKFIKNKG
ncbi:MAG: shikimate kinase [Clostridia bacterium]|jgi:shikimate kinase|nr:shikimate kinase [Clostridia bacterium]